MSSLNIPHPSPSVGERRGQRLTPLQTNLQPNFSRPKVQAVAVPPPRPPRAYRPRPEEYQDITTGERVPLDPKVKRQSSKSGLRSLFGRDKPRKSDTKLPHINELQNAATQSASRSIPPSSPTSCTTPKTTISQTLAASPTTESHTHRAIPPPTRHNTQPVESRSATSDTVWKPPPLFQAYPQALKHDSLPAPALSADSILRFHTSSAAKGSSRDEDRHAGHHHKGDTAEDMAARLKKEEKEKSKHMRSLSETMGRTEWTQKVYILATSGYILQYSGSGKHDRLPEKMLQLGPKSVAFASDAIPGKHWVLQVSQTTEEDGPGHIDAPRNRFSRFGFHRTHARRMARSFLLVFSSPEDLSSWLLAVRAQIEARGGKKYMSEKVYDEGMEHELQPKISTRQLVKRDPNRFSQVYLQPQHLVDGRDPISADPSVRSSPISPKFPSIDAQHASESRSASVSTTRTELTSTSIPQARYYSASPPQSNPSSPPNASAISAVLTALEVPGSPPNVGSVQDRQSMYLPKMSVTPEPSDQPRAQSTLPDPILRSASPPAPNFSVPSFSRRFAAKPVRPPAPPSQTQVPAIPREESNSITNGLAGFPSPPLSPVKSIDSLASAASPEQYAGFELVSRRKSLRASNSEASLIDPARHQARRLQRMSRAPGKGDMAHINEAPVRPPSIVVDDGPAGPGLHIPHSPPDHGDASSRREQIRNRMSVARPTASDARPTSIVSRRKSLPGLAIGPPAAPPPNCPLPKIPSPGDPPTAALPDPPSPDRQACKSPPPTSTRTRRKSVVSAVPRPGPAPPPPILKPRQSRVAS